MTDDLRTRLTALIYDTVAWRTVDVPVAQEVAEAVIRELEADYFLLPKRRLTPLWEFVSELGIEEQMTDKMALAEMWRLPDGRIAYRQTNWAGFFKVLSDFGGDDLTVLPTGSVPVILNGVWLADNHNDPDETACRRGAPNA